MKTKFLLIALVTLMSTSTFAKAWYYDCPGGGRVYFSTSNDTTATQAGAMGAAWCNNR